MRRLSMFRDQLTEDRIWCLNRMHRGLTIYFPEYKDAQGKMYGAFAMELLKCGYSRAGEILRYAEQSVGMKDGAGISKEAVKWFAEKILELDRKLIDVEAGLWDRCREIPAADYLLEIPRIGRNILSEILSEIGDISWFDDAKEIWKLGGMGFVACSSGKHKGETKISHRGRVRGWGTGCSKRQSLRVVHVEEFWRLHEYYTTRTDNPLKKMQSLIVIACKLLRIIFTILRDGTKYDPAKMLNDIRRIEKQAVSAAV